jgi:hypothetical protein
MRETALANRSGDLLVWGAALAAPPIAAPGRVAAAALFGLGLAVTAASCVMVWHMAGPDATVSARIVADGGSADLGRRVLAETSLRFAGAAGDPVLLDPSGTALTVAVTDHDPAAALLRVQSLVQEILDNPVAPSGVAEWQPHPRDALLAERVRLNAAIDAADAQAAAISGRITDVLRDTASGSRAAAAGAADRPGRETLDKGAAMLADLQLQRIQLLTRYQNDFPAVVALNGQIQSLRSFLADETRRVQGTAPQSPPDPAAAMLAGEASRLKAELAQVDDRRRALTAGRTILDSKLAALPSDLPLAVRAASATVLVAAATTISYPPDPRRTLVPVLAGAGFVLSGLLALLRLVWRASPAPMQPCFLLEQVEGGGTVLTRVLPQADRALASHQDGFAPGFANPSREARSARFPP